MNMQDNELDNLFRSGLSQIEVEPDARVWKGVDAHISPEGKKSRLPLMRIAATIVLVLTAGVWVFKSYKQPKPVTGNKVALKSVTPVVTEVPNATSSINEAEAPGLTNPQHHSARQKANRIAAINRPADYKKAMPAQHVAAVPAAQDALPQQAEGAAVQIVQNKSIDKPVLPDIALAANPLINNKPVLKTNVVPATLVTAHATESKTKKHGIHTLGDLINVVVAKVDKREDKLIEFTDVDDEATVTGINLGFIKIKQDN